jgi:hypothetical protein
MYEVLSQLCFLKPVLKFSVQIFYQPLFSIFPSAIVPFSLWHFPFDDSFPFSSFSHFPLAFSLQQFFSLPKASHTKKPKVNPQKVLLLGSLIAASRVEPQAGA